jgi:epoxyqueuosine reductase
MEPAALTAWIKERAHEMGFVLVGVSADVPKAAADFYDWWTEQGFGGDMNYLVRHRAKKRSIQTLLPEAKSALVCILPFAGPKEATPPPKLQEPMGKIARYAQGSDYHDVLAQKLAILAAELDHMTQPQHPSRAFVDSGPVNERALAAAAGLGWIGKNSMLIHPKWGSWFWIGEIITQAQMVADAPLADHCGKCRKCIDACPTQAILTDKRAIDATKCISYLSIEKRGPIEPSLQNDWQGWLVGCDICQEVCPWNPHSLKQGRVNMGEPSVETLSLSVAIAMSDAEFKTKYATRAIARVKAAGLNRNAQILFTQTNEKKA